MFNPAVTFIVPTFNADRYLHKCLQSVLKQDYKDYEVLIIDGGSKDETLAVAREFSAKFVLKILENPKVDAESGKSIGIRNARGGIIILLDSDNEIVNTTWLSTGVAIFKQHPEIWGIESPWLLNANDTGLNQYFTMLQVADPVARVFSPIPEKIENYGVYEIISVSFRHTPVIGANGFFWRRDIALRGITGDDKFEETNYVSALVTNGHKAYARLKTLGIYHQYCDSLANYLNKRRKIALKFLARKASNKYTWIDKIGGTGFAYSIIYNFTVLGPSLEAIRQIRETRNIFWLYHPVISFLTVCIYGYYFCGNYLRGRLHEH